MTFCDKYKLASNMCIVHSYMCFTMKIHQRPLSFLEKTTFLSIQFSVEFNLHSKNRKMHCTGGKFRWSWLSNLTSMHKTELQKQLQDFILAPPLQCSQQTSVLRFSPFQPRTCLSAQNHSMVIWNRPEQSQVQPDISRHSQVQPGRARYSLIHYLYSKVKPGSAWYIL